MIGDNQMKTLTKCRPEKVVALAANDRMKRDASIKNVLGAKRFAELVCALALTVAMIGCGGSSRTLGISPSPGRLTLKVIWPTSTRLIPQAANAINASLVSGSKSLGSQLLARPAGSATTSTVTFTNLPPGSATLTATAYPNADGTGTAQAQGAVGVTIVASQTASIGVTMNTTIDHLETAPVSPIVTIGQPLQLTVTAKDAAGNVVLTTPGKVTWSSASLNIATIDNTGKVTGVAVGSSVLTVTETESGKTTQATVQVSSQAGNRLSFLYGTEDNLKIVQFKINGDGTLTAVPSAAPALPVFADTIVADPLGRFVYVAESSGASSSDAIYQYSVGVDGTLTQIGGTNTVTPFGVRSGTVDPAGRFVYFTTSASGIRERLTRFVINGDGTLSNGVFANPLITGTLAVQAVTFDTSGRFVYLPSEGNGEGILQYSVNSDGTFTPLSPVVVTVNGSLKSELVAATDRFVYVVTEDSNRIGTVHPYLIGTNGSLSALATGSALTGSDPVTMSTDASRHFLYVVNGDSTVSQIKINVDGTLTPLSPASVATSTDPTQIVFDPAGKFAYVPCNNRVISLYSVNPDGTLTTISLATPGITPGDLLDFIVTLKH